MTYAARIVVSLNTNRIYHYCSSDGAAIVVSSLLGSSPCTVFVESASGIREGMRPFFAALSACRPAGVHVQCGCVLPCMSFHIAASDVLHQGADHVLPSGNAK
jgi:xanthine/uracil/vitamin C permease (AzgA family)